MQVIKHRWSKLVQISLQPVQDEITALQNTQSVWLLSADAEVAEEAAAKQQQHGR
jgi:hypothetical protein